MQPQSGAHCTFLSQSGAFWAPSWNFAIDPPIYQRGVKSLLEVAPNVLLLTPALQHFSSTLPPVPLTSFYSSTNLAGPRTGLVCQLSTKQWHFQSKRLSALGNLCVFKPKSVPNTCDVSPGMHFINLQMAKVQPKEDNAF